MNNLFPQIKKNFGFGCMRLPMIGEEVDIEQFKTMVDMFMEAGFNYFDTAHVYINGKSELAIKEALTSRYPRESYILTDKLSDMTFNSEEEAYKIIDQELEACGVEYFDFLLMHCQMKSNYEKYQKTNAYKVGLKLKEMGKVKHLGFSFHDSADFLDQILTENPFFEVVQLQFNYFDYEDDRVQSKACYDVCVKHNKPVIVMEPVKGGSLVNLPSEADKLLRELKNGSNASYAIRFAASHENVMMVLSGMSNIEQMQDNLSFMKEFKELSEEEITTLNKVVEIFHSKKLIACTNCRYCMEGCPVEMPIPFFFRFENEEAMFTTPAQPRYDFYTSNHTKASQCTQCGQCESACPQHLPIIELLEDIKAKYEK